MAEQYHRQAGIRGNAMLMYPPRILSQQVPAVVFRKKAQLGGVRTMSAVIVCDDIEAMLSGQCRKPFVALMVLAQAVENLQSRNRVFVT